jgi:hypothetical protein
MGFPSGYLVKILYTLNGFTAEPQNQEVLANFPFDVFEVLI